MARYHLARERAATGNLGQLFCAHRRKNPFFSLKIFVNLNRNLAVRFYHPSRTGLFYDRFYFFGTTA